MTDEPLDAGWAEWYDCYFGAYDADAEFFFEEARRCTGKVLEAGCGTGRLMLPMLQDGADVVGFDPVEPMLEQLKRKAANLKLTPRVSRQSMESFRYDEHFDLIIVPFRVFNHCLDPASQGQALENFRRHLAPDGRLIVSTFVPDPELILSASNTIQYMSTVQHPETGRAVICSHFNLEVDILNQIRTDVWVYEELDDEQRILRKVYLPLRIRWVYPSEMALLLERAGFNQFEVYGSFDRDPLEDGCLEQVWVVRCP